MNDETISQEASAAVVHPEGDLVAANLPVLRTKLREMAATGIRQLTLDLAATQMVDSSGIGLLIGYPTKALTNPDLKGSTFVVAGHTDAAGGEAYNQDLSERRADSIKRYLVDKYGINGSDLVTVGYGKSKLKDPSQPMAEANRRVQVVNMENKTTASK